MLTTVDNPFDPRTDYNQWNQWDIDNGYNTASYLARILQNYEKVDEEYSKSSIQEAMQEIIDMDMINKYKII